MTYHKNKKEIQIKSRPNRHYHFQGEGSPGRGAFFNYLKVGFNFSLLQHPMPFLLIPYPPSLIRKSKA